MTARCPLCSSPVEVRSLGAFGFEAHCSECFDGDPEASEWAHLRGIGETREQAIGAWLDDARLYAAADEIPGHPIPFVPRDMFADLQRQVNEELELQRGVTYE